MTIELATEIKERQEQQEESPVMRKILETPIPVGKNLVHEKDSDEIVPGDVLRFTNELQFLFAFRKYGESHGSFAIWDENFSVKFRKAFNKKLTEQLDYFASCRMIGDIPEEKLEELESLFYTEEK